MNQWYGYHEWNMSEWLSTRQWLTSGIPDSSTVHCIFLLSRLLSLRFCKSLIHSKQWLTMVEGNFTFGIRQYTFWSGMQVGFCPQYQSIIVVWYIIRIATWYFAEFIVKNYQMRKKKVLNMYKLMYFLHMNVWHVSPFSLRCFGSGHIIASLVRQWSYLKIHHNFKPLSLSTLHFQNWKRYEKKLRKVYHSGQYCINC